MVNVDAEKCIGCGECTEVCSFDSLFVDDGIVAFKEGGTCNECGHCAAICPTEAISVVGYDQSETLVFNKEKFTLSPEIFLNVLKFRRSAREFKGSEIPPEKLQAVLEAGRYSPTASNRQPLRYIVLGKKAAGETCTLAHSIFKAATDDVEHREELIREKFKGVPRYYDVWIPKCKNYFEKGIDKLFYNAPCVIIMVAKKDDPWAIKDSSIAYGNMDMMASTLGLGTCFIGMFELAGGVDRKLYEHVGIKEDETPFVTFVMGEPRVSYIRTAIRKKLNITTL
ncbi:MAG: nitroreductase family protein [Lachnospiraceae bacterium]|nr:nitroreductase family protein [Lachnospiraceae bacterium]